VLLSLCFLFFFLFFVFFFFPHLDSNNEISYTRSPTWSPADRNYGWVRGNETGGAFGSWADPWDGRPLVKIAAPRGAPGYFGHAVALNSPAGARCTGGNCLAAVAAPGNPAASSGAVYLYDASWLGQAQDRISLTNSVCFFFCFFFVFCFSRCFHFFFFFSKKTKTRFPRCTLALF
jgi:hypothetical protein